MTPQLSPQAAVIPSSAPSDPHAVESEGASAAEAAQPPRAFDDFSPVNCGSEGYIYVVGFVATTPVRHPQSLVKVGMTVVPGSRLYQHSLSGFKNALRIGFVWISEPHVFYPESERELLRWCRKQLGIPPQARGEVFTNITPQAVVEHALLALPLQRHADYLAAKGLPHDDVWDWMVA